MKLYTVDVEQTIFHNLSILANTAEEAKEKVNEIIRIQKPLSTSQLIEITSINCKN